MSIIYDALKKVQTSQAAEPKAGIKKKARPWPNAYLLYALIIFLCLFIANVLYGRFFKKSPPKVTATAIKAQALVEKKELSSRPPAPDKTIVAKVKDSAEAKIENVKEIFQQPVLNGVFFSGNEGYALINNRIVKQGDKVDGATVVGISLDEVVLERNGSVIKLSGTAK